MTVYELMTRQTPKGIAGALLKLKHYTENDKYERVLKSCTSVLSELLALEAVPVDDKLLCVSLIDEFDETKRNDFLLYDKEVLSGKFTAPSKLNEVVDIDSLSLAELDFFLGKFEFPQSYAQDFIPWEEILGYNLIDENVSDYGGTIVAAEILYEITLWGFSNSAVKNKGKELADLSNDPDSFKSMTNEEFEELVKSFGADDTETAEEKEAEEIKSKKIGLKNKLIIYNTLKKHNICVFEYI